MKTARLLVLAPFAAAIAIAGCGGGGAHSASRRTPPAVKLDHSKFGGFLVDGQNRALYLFAADKTSASTCYSACASIWPPLKSTGSVKAGSGVAASALGTTKRKDGTTEVTYRGHPLYYYAGDANPGDTAGQGLNQFGARWYLLTADGSGIKSNAR